MEAPSDQKSVEMKVDRLEKLHRSEMSVEMKMDKSGKLHRSEMFSYETAQSLLKELSTQFNSYIPVS